MENGRFEYGASPCRGLNPRTTVCSFVGFTAHLLSWSEGPIGPGHPAPSLDFADLSTASSRAASRPASGIAVPPIPRQQPVDQPPAPLHDLARQLDHRGAERPELHPEQLPRLRPFGATEVCSLLVIWRPPGVALPEHLPADVDGVVALIRATGGTSGCWIACRLRSRGYWP